MPLENVRDVYSIIMSNVYLGRTTISPPLRTTTSSPPEPSTQRPTTTPSSNTCDIYGALRCLGGVTASTNGPVVQSITNITADHLHNICM